MRPCRQLALDRRTFLRGAASALALPWLDAMQPAMQPQLAARVRCLFVFSPNGMNMNSWRPRGTGGTTEFGATLAALQPFRDRLTVFSGLAIDGGRAHGDGPGDHARAAASFLTCAHPRKTGGADLQAGVSIDQRIAQQIGAETTYASLELGMDRGASAGICDSGYSCAYSNNISWRTPNTPVAKEADPRAVFARLFGDPDAAKSAVAARQQRLLQRRVLDAVLADAKSLAKELDNADRQKLDQYLQSVDELDLRLQRLENGGESAPSSSEGLSPERLAAMGSSYAERLAVTYEMVALAFAADRTRVVSFMLGNAGSNRSYKFLDVPEGHHDLSHHGNKQEKLDKIARIDRFQVEQFADFLGLLQARQEQDSDLLARSLIVFGSAIGDGNRHNHDDLPMLLAGEGGGAARGRGHVQLREETPAADLYLAMLRAMGGEDERFADSKSVLTLR